MGGHGMTKGRFADEFKEEAVKQVIERGYAVGDVTWSSFLIPLS